MVLPVQIEVSKSEVKSTKPYDFSKLYNALHDFLYEESYGGDGDAGFPEEYYWESRSQSMGTEYWIWWRGKKAIAGNKFMRRALDIDIHGVGIKEQEIMYGGKRVKIYKGKFELIIRGKLEIDYEGKWRKSSLAFLFEIFWKRLWRKEAQIYMREIAGDVITVQDFARNFMGLPTVARRSEMFYPKHGYEQDNW
ncbi:hypothetical protein JXB31_03715 [Candidatus Woesearchaeota archaeon]|nr:hypothetical protein [Candidatus Woesearchaeota archaeon]